MLIKTLTICKQLHQQALKPPITLPQSFKFSSYQTRYPYKFGGIQRKQKRCHMHYLTWLFGENQPEGFKLGYVAILDAMMRKDKKFIAENMSKQLANNIEFENVKLINEKYPISILSYNIFLVIGGSIQRTTQNNKIFSCFANHPSQPDLYFSPEWRLNLQSIPFLICCQAYYKTECKLIMKQQTPDNIPQVHMLQFETKLVFSQRKLLRILLYIAKKKLTNEQQKQLEEIIGDYEWKVTDIDHFLNGNFVKTYRKNNLTQKMLQMFFWFNKKQF